MAQIPYPTSFQPENLVEYSVEVSDGLFGPGILLFVFTLIFLVLSSFGVTKRLSASLFTCFVFSTFLFILGGISVEIVVFLAFITSLTWFLQEN